MRGDINDSDDDSETTLNTAPASPRHNQDVRAQGPVVAAATEVEQGIPSIAAARSEPVAWRDLPHRQQLVIITLARLSEPLVQTSLQAYLFYQLKWFDPSLPDSTISSQAGVLHASFTAAQFVTAMLWGRVADSKLAGRKTVLLIGLLGTAVSAVGFGFSTNFWQALMFRIIGGITNGNVGVMRTMISEIVREKKYQSRAFLLLPMTFNIGVIIGPILGGVLSDPAGSYPSLFGNVEFFLKYPYATPNLLSGVFLTLSGLAIWLGLEETLDSLRGRKDFGIRVGEWLMGRWRSRTRDDVQYQPLSAEDTDVELSGESVPKTAKRRYTQRLAFRRIFTRNVSMTLAAHFFLAFHIGSFNSLWFTFLSTPVYDPRKSEHETKLPFRFTGGIGMQPRTIGVATAIFGVIGITMQLGLYPRISHRLGTILSWRLALLCFPFAYLLIPYLSVMPSTSDPPAAKNGPLLWIMIVVVLVIQVTGRTFALPGQAILVNNCSPHPSVLGTVHGLGQSVSSAARTIGPMTSGFVYGYGLNHGVVGVVFWLLSLVAVTGLVVSISVREGDGHEIWLEDDEEEP